MPKVHRGSAMRAIRSHHAAAWVLLAAVGAAVPTGPSASGSEAAPVNGLVLALTADRTDCRPGEALALSGQFRNAGKRPLLVQYVRVNPADPWPADELHLALPDGKQYVLDTWKARPGGVFLPAGESRTMRATTLRLTTSGWWRPIDGDKVVEISLRREGAYRIWFAHAAPKGWDGHEAEWHGTAVSNAVTFTVRPLPPEKRRAAPTVGQWADLSVYLSPKSQPAEQNEAKARLCEAALRTENEALALEVLRIVRGGDTFRGERIAGLDDRKRYLLAMLCRRAFERTSQPDKLSVRPGIDGPYLTQLADLVLSWMAGEAELAAQATAGSELPYVLQAHLGLHPEDAERRRRTIAAMKPCVDVVALAQSWRMAWSRPSNPQRPAPARCCLGLTAAWKLLMDIGAVHDGMTLERAIEVLGEPTDRGAKYVGWYLNTPRHVNPYLVAEVEGDRLKAFRTTSR